MPTKTQAWEITWIEPVDELGATENYRAVVFTQAAADHVVADLREGGWAEDITVRRTRVTIRNPEHPLYTASA